MGLSPRVRGNLQGAARLANAAGTIPACAGEPRLAGRMAIPPWDYPRVCGGTVWDALCEAEREGLSPRVRGNLRACPVNG